MGKKNKKNRNKSKKEKLNKAKNAKKDKMVIPDNLDILNISKDDDNINTEIESKDKEKLKKEKIVKDDITVEELNPFVDRMNKEIADDKIDIKR